MRDGSKKGPTGSTQLRYRHDPPEYEGRSGAVPDRYTINQNDNRKLPTSDRSKKRAAPHPLSACANQIEEAGLFSERYGRGYWLRKLSVYAKVRKIEPEVLDAELFRILKEIGKLDPKYSKGGRLTNLLAI